MRARRTPQTATRTTATDTPTRRALCSTGGTDNGQGDRLDTNAAERWAVPLAAP